MNRDRFPTAIAVAVATAIALLASCSSSDDTSTDGTALPVPGVDSVADAPPVFVPSDDVATSASGNTTTTSPASTTTLATTTSTSTTTSTTTTSTTLPPATPAATLDLSSESLLLGTSIEGRPIIAERFGTAGDRRVLVIGVIHGNEDAGVAVIDLLRSAGESDGLPEDVELWLVESMNPDGQVAQDRHNANEVDLNRNFPYRWGPIGGPGDSQYAGPEPGSEPETRAMVNFITELQPDLAIWFHQDANLVIPGTGRDGAIRARYAELTGLPLAQCCAGGGTYTGIAATWARNEAVAPDGVAFIVELPGGDLSQVQTEQHTAAVLTVAAEL